MRQVIALTSLLALVLAVSSLASGPAVSVRKNLISMPLAFTENQGQWDEQVLYRANAGGATMWFAADGAYYQFSRRADDVEKDISERSGQMKTTGAQEHVSGLGRDKMETMIIKAALVGANSSPIMRGENRLDYKCNYFLGDDPTGWRTDVANYGAVVYEEVYPGIDLKYYGNGKEMEYDFIVSPGADPSRIRVQYEGVESISVNADGELIVRTRWGEVIERRPVVYQTVNGARVPIEGRYEITGGNSFGFSIGAGYNQALPLVIDPVLSYSTYLGGTDDDCGWAVALDGSGCAYIAGETKSTDFPTENPYIATHQGYLDVFVTKLNSSGDGLIYSTYIGGSNNDCGRGIAIDGSGCAYVTGTVASSDFPTVNPYQGSLQGWNCVFITKLNSSGNDLLYSTYLGGSTGYDWNYGGCIAVDGSGCAYVAGETFSFDFPTKNPYQTYQGMEDVFVTKLNSLGNDLVYSTYLGGYGGDREPSGLAVDASGCAYVTGWTDSPNFPTVNAYQSSPPGFMDVFVTKLNSAGDGLVYSTYLGGSDAEYSGGIAIDGSGCAYVTGTTNSTDFPTRNPYQADQANSDAFVTKFNATGDDLAYSTYLGGGQYEGGDAIAVDGSGCAYVTGGTSSTDFPTEDPYQTHQGGSDVFVTKLSSTGDGLVYSTYLGGTSGDVSDGIAVDGWGHAYVTGYTVSSDFPTENAYQDTHQGRDDVFVTKLVEGTPCCEIRGDVNHDGYLSPGDITYLINYAWKFGPAPPCPEEADVNGDGELTPADISYLIEFAWLFGPEPVPCP